MSHSTPKETRFAVVMYGGVSLAIYINGIAQELYRMVTATADSSGARGMDCERGSERVYKEIGEKLNTRFVVDVLSGTSAGGINGIFLAKALACGQSIKSLEQMWLDEGNIEVLINDRGSKDSDSKADVGYPKSLLNSERMYNHLLKAFSDMDDPPAGAPQARPPLVDELDLYVTATDLQGFPVPLKLSDIVVIEKRHQNIFHFRFKNKKEQHNDFVKANNPFLAFAARCTSAFPFAFEPMRLQDISTDIEHEQWRKFYEKYLLDPALCDKRHPHKHEKTADGRYDLFTKRSFADGGYLDNKPFSYAINAITARGSDVPVDRKLIYIEPSPDEPPVVCAVDDPPNAIENVGKVFSLATYETIQQDLQRVMERNRLIERVKRILKGTTDDFSKKEGAPSTARDWNNEDLRKMITYEGIGYGGYLRLRVAQLTDDLTEMIARHAGLDVQSDLFLAARYIVRVWRDDLYEYYKKQDKKNFNQFLYDYDLCFMIRRLSYTIYVIDSMLSLVDSVNQKKDWETLTEEDKEKIRMEYSEFFFEVVKPIKTQKDIDAFRKRLQILRRELGKRRESMYHLQERLLKPAGTDKRTKASDEIGKLAEAIGKIGISPDDMKREILGDRSENENGQSVRSESESYQAASKFLHQQGRMASFSNVAKIIERTVRKADAYTSLCKVEMGLGTLEKNGEKDTADGKYLKELSILLDNEGQDNAFEAYGVIPVSTIPDTVFQAPQNPVERATWLAAIFFRRFMWYDEVAYPIIQFSGVGQELDEVEIVRISPNDAKSLSKGGVRKLGGTTLGHFGAFLDRTWRKNDILWGRLDGAERIIKSVLAKTPYETEIPTRVKEAHMAIIQETFFEQKADGSNDCGRLRIQETLDLLVQLVLGKSNADQNNSRDKMILGQGADAEETLKSIMGEILNGKLDKETIYEWLKEYEVSRDVNPQLALESITRSTQVIGKMLDVMSAEYQALKRPAAWITRIGAFAWGVVEAAVPNSLPDLITRRLTALVTLIAVILIAGGFSFNERTLMSFGAYLLIGTAGFVLIKSYLGDILIRKKKRATSMWRLLRWIISAVIVILAAIGFHYLPDAWDGLLHWFKG